MLDKTSDNYISPWGKFFAGVMLITATFFVIYTIIAYWPDKMPSIKEGDEGAWYTNKPFHISLITETNPVAVQQKKDSLTKLTDAVSKQRDSLQKLTDSIARKNAEAEILQLDDSLKFIKATISDLDANKMEPGNSSKIHLNTILLILVALMGFLGNMVHIASSFTSFVGNDTFKRSWILWYFVKPFTASGLAIIIYFIIRAGFLSYGAGAGGVSLYGVLSIAALAGLFTDSATLKLKEVFEVIFKPKDERKDKLDGDEFSVTRIFPETIPTTTESILALTGKNLDKADIKITIDNTVITPTSKTATLLTIKYTPIQTAVTAGKAVLLITDGTNKPLYAKDIKIA